MFVLIAYDIGDDKRLRQVAKMMKEYGARVQHSIFECNISEQQLITLAEKLKSIIKKKEDKVQIYHLCGACKQRFGQYQCHHLTTDGEVYIY